MDLGKYCGEIERIYGRNLKSIILYGSAASGDYTKKFSDYNLLIVLEKLGLGELKQISKVTNKWVKLNNPPPLMFTLERINNSLDVFPIEFLDIKDNHKVLYGEDPFKALEVNTANLRLELEHELKSKLIRFRELYILTEGNSSKVAELLVKSSSSFIALFKAVLRLTGDTVPVKKMEAVKLLCGKLNIKVDIFERIQSIRDNPKSAKNIDAEKFAETYIDEINKVIEFVDKFQK